MNDWNPRDEIRKLIEYPKRVRALARRGLSNSVARDLLHDGTAALPQVEALEALTPEQLRRLSAVVVPDP